MVLYSNLDLPFALSQCMWDGFKPEALEVIRLNTVLFPASWNVYDSYADMLSKSGKKKAAILMYQKALKMNPKDSDARQALVDLNKQ
jgi:tetratricopeptide (TPR) repeat protein